MNKFWRFTIYMLGTLALAAGITLNTKTGLGVSPMVSVSFGLSENLGLKFSVLHVIFYVFLVLGQMALDRKITWAHVLQLPVSAVFGVFLDLLGVWITYDYTAHGLVANLVLLVAAMFFTALGVCLMVNMDLVMNPGDGIVLSMSKRMNRDMGFAKNVYDIICVVFTCVTGLLLRGRIAGIGLGTVISMVCVGRFIAVINKATKQKMLRLAGLG